MWWGDKHAEDDGWVVVGAVVVVAVVRGDKGRDGTDKSTPIQRHDVDYNHSC